MPNWREHDESLSHMIDDENCVQMQSCKLATLKQSNFLGYLPRKSRKQKLEAIMTLNISREGNRLSLLRLATKDKLGTETGSLGLYSIFRASRFYFLG